MRVSLRAHNVEPGPAATSYGMAPSGNVVSVMAPSANMRPWLFILVLRVSTASSICSRT